MVDCCVCVSVFQRLWLIVVCVYKEPGCNSVEAIRPNPGDWVFDARSQ